MIRTLNLLTVYFVFCWAVFTPFALKANSLETAINNYQSGKLEEAQTSLQELLNQDPENTAILYNLGLAEYKLGNKGKALGYWRKAQAISPQFKEVLNALNYAESQNPSSNSQSESSLTKLLNWTANTIPLWIPFCVALIFLFLFIKTSLRYLHQRKKALAEDLPGPGFPNSLWLHFIMTAIVFLPLLHSLKLSNENRGTVISKRVEARTGPDNSNASLFELLEGEDLLVLDKTTGWYKIRDGNSRLGWIQEESLFITRGEK